MSDKWDEMWKLQQEQQVFFGLDPNEMTRVAASEAANMLSLGLYEEAAELARAATRFKAHILRLSDVDKSNVAEEAADVLKYVLSIAQLHGIEAVELHEAFCRKTHVVADRAKGEQLVLSHDTKLVIVDLDGCVADLSVLASATRHHPLPEQERVKETFRRGGGYADLPLIHGAKEGLALLRELGYKIVIITARPHRQHKRLYGDTLGWLKKHDIAYDLILFRRDKAEALCEHIFPAQPTCFIEDRAKHALEIVDMDVPVLLLDNDGNRTVDHELITRVADWTEIIDAVKSERREHGKPNTKSDTADVD